MPMFQSRNRGAFGFKLIMNTFEYLGILAFQSRNRGAFGFKSHAGRTSASGVS